MKFGGQLIHYVQRRFYAGNNGLLGFFGYNASRSPDSRSPTSCSTRCPAKGAAASPRRGRTCTTARRCMSRMTSRSRQELTLNLGLRWAYTQPVVEKDNRQSNFDLRTGAQIFPDDSSREGRALYQAYKKGFEPRLGLAWRAGRTLGGPRRVRHLAVHGRDRRQPSAAAQSSVLLRVRRRLRRDLGPGNSRHGLRGAQAARPAVGPGARVGSQPAAAVHAAVERLRRIPGDRIACRPTSATWATTPTIW